MALAAGIASRAFLTASARSALPACNAPFWALPLRDLLTAAVWIGGFFGRGVRWHENRYVVESDGRVTLKREAPLRGS